MTPMLRDAYDALREAQKHLVSVSGNLILARDIARQLGYSGWQGIEEVLNAVEVALDDQTEFAENIVRDNRTNPNTCLEAEVAAMNKHLQSLPFDMPRDMDTELADMLVAMNKVLVEQIHHA